MDLAWRIDYAVARLSAVTMALHTRGSQKPKDFMPAWPGSRPRYPTAEELQIKLLAVAAVQNAALLARAGSR